MENIQKPCEETFRRIVMELKEPVVFHGMLKNVDGTNIWKFLDWDLSELARKLGDMSLPFRTGYNARTMEPQWDVKCSTKSMTMTELLENIRLSPNAKEWYYFDYKYMHEWLKDKPEILESLDWLRFGFNKGANDSTLWIGSKGAHTNCHQDSYGCNLVAQIHGRKEWLLFPPSSSPMLKPTRIPYEESTIYSKFNFFCPTKEDEDSIIKIPEGATSLTLERGDVLFVPGGWWHYVESLDLSISVNVWLPLTTDCRARLKEALVKLIIARIGKNIPAASDEPRVGLRRCVNLIETCVEECKVQENEDIQPPCDKRARKAKCRSSRCLFEEYPNCVSIPRKLESSELRKLLVNKRERFNDYATTNRDPETSYVPPNPTIEAIVNAFSHPDVISRVAELITKDADEFH